VKQRLAAIRHLFDRLVVGQIVPLNPVSSVQRTPSAVGAVKREGGKRHEIPSHRIMREIDWRNDQSGLSLSELPGIEALRERLFLEWLFI
jgi:hypothetical protein